MDTKSMHKFEKMIYNSLKHLKYNSLKHLKYLVCTWKQLKNTNHIKSTPIYEDFDILDVTHFNFKTALYTTAANLSLFAFLKWLFEVFE